MSTHLIIYSSKSLIPPAYEQREIEQLVTKSVDRNRDRAVTGALLCTEGRRFAQALEGNLPAVAAIMQKIHQDPRHSNIVTLHNGPVDARLFTSWSLAFNGHAVAVDYAIHDAEREARLPYSNALRELLQVMTRLAGANMGGRRA